MTGKISLDYWNAVQKQIPLRNCLIAMPNCPSRILETKPKNEVSETFYFDKVALMSSYFPIRILENSIHSMKIRRNRLFYFL